MNHLEFVEFIYHGTAIKLFTHKRPDHLFDVLSRDKTFYELDLLRAAETVYVPGTTIVDVGANIGNHSVFFAKCLSAKVLAFEPFRPTRDILLMNLSANGCEGEVAVKGTALGEVSGRCSARSRNPTNLGMVVMEADPHGDTTLSTLDEFVTADMQIGIVKIDVEGGEAAVIKGARSTLKQHQPHIFIEAADTSDLEVVTALLSPYGYQVRGRYCATATYHFSV